MLTKAQFPPHGSAELESCPDNEVGHLQFVLQSFQAAVSNPSATPTQVGIHPLWVLTLQTGRALSQAWLEELIETCHPSASLGLEWTPIPDTSVPANW